MTIRLKATAQIVRNYQELSREEIAYCTNVLLMVPVRILERPSQDMEETDVIQFENTWIPKKLCEIATRSRRSRVALLAESDLQARPSERPARPPGSFDLAGKCSRRP